MFHGVQRLARPTAQPGFVQFIIDFSLVLKPFRADMKNWLPFAVLFAAILGSIVPLLNVLELWNLPNGSGIRPMGLPMQIIVYGLGTPAVVITLTILTFNRLASDPNGNWSGRLLYGGLALLSCSLALLPLLLSTVVTFWIIRTHNLWLKP